MGHVLDLPPPRKRTEQSLEVRLVEGGLRRSWWLVASVVPVLGRALESCLSGSGEIVMKSAREIRRAYGERRWRSGWPALALQLGWDVGFPDGRRMVPDLVAVRWESEDTLKVSCRPLAHQGREGWGKMAEQLRRELRASVCSHRESASGVLEVTLGMKALPETVAMPVEALEDSLDGAMRLGLIAGGGEAVWRPFEVPHLLVAGKTNRGKGVVVRSCTAQALASGWQVYIVNPKRSGEYAVWKVAHGVPVLTELGEVNDLLGSLLGQMFTRQAFLEERGVGSWLKLRGRGELPAGWHPVLLVVDEASALLTPDKSDKKVEALQLNIGSRLARYAQLGRSSGMHMVMLTQRPDASQLGPSGGSLRNNIEARVVVGSLDDEGLRMMFPSIDPERKSDLYGLPGRALCSQLNRSDEAVYTVQMYYLDEEDDQLRRLRVVAPQGLRALP